MSGLKYVQVVSRKNIRVDKSQEMLGSYGPQKEPYEKKFEEEEAPSGMLARGHYEAKVTWSAVIPFPSYHILIRAISWTTTDINTCNGPGHSILRRTGDSYYIIDRLLDMFFFLMVCRLLK